MSGKRARKIRKDAKRVMGQMSERERKGLERFLKAAHKRGQRVVLG
jgi:hypothetical protein